jgi:hypothetical protein
MRPYVGEKEAMIAAEVVGAERTREASPGVRSRDESEWRRRKLTILANVVAGLIFIGSLAALGAKLFAHESALSKVGATSPALRGRALWNPATPVQGDRRGTR